MLTFFRPQQLPRTTEAGLVLAPDQKEGPSSSHTATENIYTAGTLEPWGCSALLPGPVLWQWEGSARVEEGPGAAGRVRVPQIEQRITTKLGSKSHVTFTSPRWMDWTHISCFQTYKHRLIGKCPHLCKPEEKQVVGALFFLLLMNGFLSMCAQVSIMGLVSVCEAVFVCLCWD